VSFPTVTFFLAISAGSFCCKVGVPVVVRVPVYIDFHAVLDVLLLLASPVLSFLLLLGSSCFSEYILFWHPCVLFWKYLHILTSVLLFCRRHRNQEQFYGSCLCYYSGYTIGSENDIYIHKQTLLSKKKTASQVTIANK
jgi:hypothetical protein